jgi:HK97 family phage portal protein
MKLFAQRSFNYEIPTLYGSGVDDAIGRTEANVRINHDTVLSDDAILSAVSLLAGDIASLPMKAFETDETGLTQPLKQQPSWIEAPDPLDLAITDVQHKTQVALSILLAGNAYILCEPSVYDPVKLTVLNPIRIRVVKPDQQRRFQVMGRTSIYEDWEPSDILTTYGDDQILHIPYMLRPGRLTGLSPIDAQAGNLGISLAMRKWVETFFGKGGQVSGFIVLPETVAAQALPAIEERIATKWASWRKAGIIGVLNGGASWMKTGLSPQDADLPGLWSRQLEVAARIYGIPPFMIGSQEPAGVAYASSVERAQHYIDHCMMRYTRPMEKAYSRLVPGDARLRIRGSNTEARFVYDAFLRGNPVDRANLFQTLLQSKQRIIDEVRALDNMPPMGDYSQEQLSGPGGLLETPNNNPRLFPGGDESVPASEAAPLAKPEAPLAPKGGPTLPPGGTPA